MMSERAIAPIGRWLVLTAIVVGIACRLWVFAWQDPFGPHHPDEHLLPLETLATWEGITPREVGWPASTTMLVLDAGFAVQFLAERGRDLAQMGGHPDRVMDTLSSWIGQHYIDTRSMYVLGRSVSLATGILQLIALAWAAGRWTGREGQFGATVAVALAATPVLYSQYVLADITGLLFVTILVGQAATPTPRRIVLMAALAALAAASKFHFGLWLLTPLLAAIVVPMPLRQRVKVAAAVLVVFGGLLLTLVPWFWINPLLALKEFAGVVLVKVGGGSAPGHVSVNALSILAGIGPVAVVGLLLSPMASGNWRPVIPVAVPLVLGALALTFSAVVFERYSLVLLPGAAVLAAIGWQGALAAPGQTLNRVAWTALAVSALIAGVQLYRAEREAAETDVDVMVKRWVLEHVPRGATVAVHDESNAFLPRARAQLVDCVESANGEAAYRRKWQLQGVDRPEGADQPLAAVVLNDERFEAFWCARELAVQSDAGYTVQRYHHDPRFNAVLEGDAIERFRAGASVESKVDVLVANRDVGVGAAAAVFETRRGRRLIYVRSR